MKCTFPRYNLRDNSLQLVARHLSSFFSFSRLLHLLFVCALVYIFPMKNCFHNPRIDTPSKEILWFYDFTKKKKKTPFPNNNRSSTQTRDNNSGENSQSIWKSRYSLPLCRIRSVKGVASSLYRSSLIRGKENPKRSDPLAFVHFFFHENCFWIVSSFFLLFSEHCYNIESFLLSLYLCKDATHILYIYMSESDVAFSSFWIRYSELNIVEQRYIFA